MMNSIIKHKKITRQIFDELKAAKVKHPDWPNDMIHAAAIVGEEAGEILRAAFDYEYMGVIYLADAKSKIKNEAIQTAAMCIRLLENLE